MSIDSLSFHGGKWKLTTSEGKKTVQYTDDLSNKVEFSAHKIRKVSHKENKGFKIKKDILRLNVEDENGKIVRVGIKIKELTNFLGEKPKDLIKKGLFEVALKTKLQDRGSVDTLETSSSSEREDSSLSPVEEIIIPLEGDQQSEEELISPEALKQLSQYGLSQSECETLRQTYNHNKKYLQTLNKPTLISRKDLAIPRSIVYIPEGAKKGTHILLKTHGSDKEIGLGTFNRVTLTVHLETGAINVFRDARKKDLEKGEIEAYQITASRPDKFAIGIPVHYKGDWRDRSLRNKNEDKSKIPKELDVEKIGFLMDYIEGGNLLERLKSDPPPSTKEKIKIAAEYADALAVLHEKKLVHLDQKLENTFLTKDEHPKIGDLGFTLKKGTPVVDKNNIPCITGTPGMIAPEIVAAEKENSPYLVDYPADIWSMGCLLSELFNTSWVRRNGQSKGDWEKILDENRVNAIKTKCFKHKDDPKDYEWVIDKCLEFDPSKRPTAREVSDWFQKLL